jgi:Asp-tRNA(Asn)/Glu-tRNA(Gln) amidotransferase C subunit
MLKKYLKEYSDQNPERFNREFILSRNDEDILEHVKDIFKSLEILNEIEVLEVSLETDESQFGPVKHQHKYYKQILPSRLNKIHYKIKITPSEVVANKPLLTKAVDDEDIDLDIDDDNTETSVQVVDNSFIIERDLYINKIIDNSFYINEGIRYFLIYQIVDNSTYGTRGSVSLKSLLMPITINRRDKTVLENYLDSTKVYGDLPVYDVLLFSKRVSPVLYVMGKYAYNSLINVKVDDNSKLVDAWKKYSDPNLTTYFNEFFGVDFRFSDDHTTLVEEGRTIIHLRNNTQTSGTFVSIETKKLEERDTNTLSILGSLSDIRADKKRRINFTAEDFNKPWFWIDRLSSFFTKNTDALKRFEKVKTILISVERLMDDSTRKTLNLSDEVKENTLTIFRYILQNFDELSTADNQDLAGKRLRIHEYLLYPLRKFFSDHIYRVLNSTTRSAIVLQRIFSNLHPMYIIRQTVVNELLRYYNATNEMNLFSSLLKTTFRGPQSISKTVSVLQRDVHPSYVGRLSLVASNASDPGLSGTIVPFVKLHDFYFEKQEEE